MGWYDGRGYYGRRHGGGFFIFPLIFVGMMLLFFTRGFFFFFMPLIVLGLLAFGAFTVFRFMFGQHDGMNHQWGYDEKRKFGQNDGMNQWGNAEKRKSEPRYYTDQNGQRWQAVEDEKQKRYPNNTDFV